MKEHKNRIWFLSGMATALLVGILAFGVYYFFFSKIHIIESYISHNYLEDVSKEQVEEGMYYGMLESLEDPYSRYYTKEEYAEVLQSNDGLHTGIGVVIQQDVELNQLLIVTCYENSPASEAGILAGDILTHVDGETVQGRALSEVSQTIRESGEVGVDLTLLREGQQVEIHVAPGEYQVETATGEMLENQVGHITITDFANSTPEEFQTALDTLKEQGMEKLIIDLRDNTGGLVSSVTKILDSFMPEGTMVYMVDKQGNRKDYTCAGETPLDMPLVVLINEYSASASEILAGAVKDYEVGTLVGTTTFGKGIVQSTYQLTDGSAVKITTSTYYTPNGTCIHGTGITPDVEVELPEVEEGQEDQEVEDTQLAKALEILAEE